MTTTGNFKMGFAFYAVLGLVFGSLLVSISALICNPGDFGLYPHPTDCTKFIHCSNGVEMSCPAGLYFNSKMDYCDWPQNVQCTTSSVATTSSSTPVSTTTTTKPTTTTATKTTTTKLTTTTTATTTNMSTTPTAATTMTTKPTSTTATTSTAPTTTVSENVCTRVDGLFPHPTDCSKYYHCVGYNPYLMSCPSYLYFNPNNNDCDWPRNVQCTTSAVATTPTFTTTTTTSTKPANTSTTTTTTIPTMTTKATTATAQITTTTATTQPSTITTPQKTTTVTSSTTTQPPTITTTPKITTTSTTTTTAAIKSTVSSGCRRRVCYYTNWSQYRNSPAKFVPENVDPFLCTHVIYAFANIVNGTLTPFEWNDNDTDWSQGMYSRFNKLKTQNPNLKTLLAAGGWNMGSGPFTSLVATAATRKRFAEQSIQFLRSRGFDGLDLDWEFPANRGGPPEDKENFSLLVKELRETYEADAAATGKQRLLLAAAVSAGKPIIDSAYDIPEISKYLDFINLMSYDLHGSWETKTGHHSGLYKADIDTGDNVLLNTDWAARYWVDKGCPRDKLVIGIPTYGRTFTLASTANTNLGAAAPSAGRAGDYTQTEGFLAYYEICKQTGQRMWLEDQKVPYLVVGNLWIGYENVQSVTIKTRYVKENGYGGVMTWALPLDDFSGSVCGEGPYPLWSAVFAECQA